MEGRELLHMQERFAVNSTRQALLRFLRATRLITVVLPVANAFYRFRRWNARRQGRDELLVVYDESYFRHEEEMTLASAEQVVDTLMDMFEPTSVMDVGCGTAVYLEEFQNRGIRISGIDGSSDAIENARVASDLLICHDLREPVGETSYFDLVLCFEVGEHLPIEYADQLVSTVVRFGRTVVFSAAQPGQGGVDHVNEQKPTFWIERFQAAGFVLDKNQTRKVRQRFEALQVAWWLPRNTLVFRGTPDPALS